MPHPAAKAAPILDVAAALGLKLRGRHAHCINVAAHKGQKDERPSMVIYPDTGRYYFFACGVRGDTIDLVRAVRRVGFGEAIAWLKTLAGGVLPAKPSAARPAPAAARVPDREAVEVYAALHEMTDAVGPDTAAGRYLRGRGLDLDLVNRHHATEVTSLREIWGDLSRRFGLDRLRAAGLVSRSDNFLFARHHLLFFYFDGGQPVFVQARDLTGNTECKELSLAGLHSAVPYNVDLLRTSQERVVICEGCIDTLSALQMGLPAVGVPGVMGFRREWFDHFRHVGRVVVLFDNDDAGRRQAAELRTQFRLRCVRADAFHPEGVKDLNDLLRKRNGEGS